MIQHFKRPSVMRPGSAMPPIQLADSQLNSLAAFLLKLNEKNAAAIEDAPDFAAKGALVYQANHCGACHQVNGVGMKIGPPLNGLSKRRARSWVEQHFVSPQELSPGSIMPPYKLSAKDMDNLVTYLFVM
jgi:mono/diheme cytochrome c family protein